MFRYACNTEGPDDAKTQCAGTTAVSLQHLLLTKPNVGLTLRKCLRVKFIITQQLLKGELGVELQ